MLAWNFVRNRLSLMVTRSTYMFCKAETHNLSPVYGAMKDALATMHHGDVCTWNFVIKGYAKAGAGKKALHLFDQMQQQGIMPEKLTFVSVVFACGSHGDLAEGRRMQARILASKYGSDHVVNTALLNMQGKLGSLQNALEIFDKMSNQDVVAWTAIITVYAQQGQGLKALQLHSQMLQEGLMPDRVAFVCILDACVHASKKECQWMHVYVLINKYEDDVVVGTAVVNMCGKCGNLDTAVEVFDRMPARNVLTWSAMIAVYVQHGQGKKALQLFDDMQEQGVMPNEITSISVVAACTSEENLGAGQQMHARIVGSGFEMDFALGNSLVNMYRKCGTFEDAWRLFETLPKWDVISFTAMIAASVCHGKTKDAFQLLNRMVLGGHMPDRVTFVSILEACASPSAFSEGKIIHAFIVECGYESDILLENVLLNMYGKCGNVQEAQRMFDKMGVHDTISWNAIISVYAQQGQGQEVLHLFQQMQQETIPGKITFLSIMSVFTSHAALPYGTQLHAQVLANRLESDVSVGTALVNMYDRCGSLKCAQRVFDELRDRDLVTWTAISTVHAHHGQGKVVVQFFDRLLLECFTPDQVSFISFLSAFAGQVAISEGKRIHARLLNSAYISDVIVNNALLNMYGKCGGLEDAQRMFDTMPKWDLVSWNSLLSIYNRHAQSKEVARIFDKMRWEGYMPDKVTWTSCLTACAGVIDLAEGKRVHACIHHGGFDSDGVVVTALVNMYGKCGNLETARRMFDNLPDRTLVSWNTMIAVYAQHGLGEEALKLLDLMFFEKIMPDKATFASILAACSHTGLLVEGCHFFACMNDHGMSPSADNYSCIIDLLGRVGRLDEAESFINALPTDATARSFLALLGACRYQRDVERGERAAERVFEQDSENAAPYVLLSNLYAHAGSNPIVANITEG